MNNVTSPVAAKTPYMIAVPSDIFEAAKVMLGDAFDGTVNQLDKWVYENLPDRFIEYIEAPMKARRSRNSSRYVWTAYLA